MQRFSRTTRLSAAAALSMLCVSPAFAAKPPKPPKGAPNPALSIAASASKVTFGRSVTISGALANAPAGTKIDLQENPYPFKGFKPTKFEAVVGANGKYSIGGVAPGLNTQYRVIAKTSPANPSAGVFVNVRIRVMLSVSDRTPASGASVRFSGTAAPAHNGARALIQKRRSSGGYRTIARPLLRANGLASLYSKNLRIRAKGTYRVIVSGDADHLRGTSRRLTLRVH
jgi:hypothetical protein